ncbi:MAG: hypothetical protein ACD_39C00271G0001, partial [uncultured bacterium]
MKKSRTAARKITGWGLCLLLLLCPAFIQGSERVFVKSPFNRDGEVFLDRVQKQTFRYFTDCVNPVNGLVMDKALNLPIGGKPVDFSHAAASIAGVGFALTVYPVGV